MWPFQIWSIWNATRALRKSTVPSMTKCSPEPWIVPIWRTSTGCSMWTIRKDIPAGLFPYPMWYRLPPAVIRRRDSTSATATALKKSALNLSVCQKQRIMAQRAQMPPRNGTKVCHRIGPSAWYFWSPERRQGPLISGPLWRICRRWSADISKPCIHFPLSQLRWFAMMRQN